MGTNTISEPLPVDREHALFLFREMLRIRRFEEKAAEMYSLQKIHGFLHLYIGEEATGVGAMQAFTPDDAIVATYREHGHALARGMPASVLMAEMFGKATGCSHGHGGSMHFFDASRRFYGGYAIVGGGLPIAVGLALADKLQNRKRVTACFFGDGAVAEGEFHESMNLAALWKLPVVFLCENNLYAMGTALARHQSQINISLKAQSYGMDSKCRGRDGCACRRGCREAGCGVCQERQRTFPAGTANLPLSRAFDVRSRLVPHKGRNRGMEKARSRSRSSSLGCKEWGLLNRFRRGSNRVGNRRRDRRGCPVCRIQPSRTSRGPAQRCLCSGETVTKMTYREAMRAALRKALRNDPRVFLMGEDVGRYGGAFAVSHGLLDEFGPERIRDTPLSESAFVGAGIGAALGGMRPIVEIMTVNFSMLAMDQILNNAATLRHMSGGQFGVPLVVRVATGGGRQMAAQHSHSLEVWYAHIPGIRVLTPATVADAYGMLLAALQESDPVFIFEHATLYPMEGEIDETAELVDLNRAAVRRAGRDVTLITYGGTLGKTLQAAEHLAGEAIDAEVIDLRSLRPLDTSTIVDSVAKTHRAVIVDESWRTGSFAAEVSAQIMELAFDNLDAPVARVCSAEVPMPYAKHLEAATLPQVEGIVNAARSLVSRHG